MLESAGHPDIALADLCIVVCKHRVQSAAEAGRGAERARCARQGDLLETVRLHRDASQPGAAVLVVEVIHRSPRHRRIRYIVSQQLLCVCVFVCPRSHLRNYTSDLHQIFIHVMRGSVLLWRPSDTLCTSGFIDDVIFARKPRLLVIAAQLRRSAHSALGLAVRSNTTAGQRTHGTTIWVLKVTFQVATLGAESAVCDCLFYFVVTVGTV